MNKHRETIQKYPKNKNTLTLDYDQFYFKST